MPVWPVTLVLSLILRAAAVPTIADVVRDAALALYSLAYRILPIPARPTDGTDRSE